jgi:hypothetical protein
MGCSHRTIDFSIYNLTHNAERWSGVLYLDHALALGLEKKGDSVSTRFRHEEQTIVRRSIMKVLRTGAIVVGLAVQMQIAGALNVFGYDVIVQVEDILHQAAKASPQWHTKQDTIRRDVHDITFSLEQAWKAAEYSRHTERKDYAEQALLILRRATARGYFDRAKTEPVVALIRGLLSGQAG